MEKVFLTIIAVLMSISLYGIEKNIFERGKGVEKQPFQAMPNNRDFDSDKEFIAYSKAFRQNKNLLQFCIPENTAKKVYHFAGLGPFAVNGASVYQLRTSINKLRQMDVAFIFVSFFKDNKTLGSQKLLTIPAKQNAAMIGYFVDFATPVQADKIIIWFGLSGNGKNLKPGVGAVLSDIKIIEKKKIAIAGNSVGIVGKNLAPVFDFEDKELSPLSKWEFMKSGSSKNKLDVNIVNNENNKSLHIRKTDSSKYSWFHFCLPKGDFYYGNLFRFSLRIKGNGKVRTGIWWKKLGGDYEYYNSELLELTDKWQNVQYEVYCNDPVTTSAAIAICLDSGEQIDIQVDDIIFMVMKPKL